MPALLPLTVLVTFLLTTGRWGSYLGLPSASIFITDVGLVVTGLWLLVWHRRSFHPVRLQPLVPVLFLLAWAMLRFAIGGDFRLIAARDLAPYGYLFVVLTAGFVAAAFRRTLFVLAAGLLAHLLWVLVALLVPRAPDHLPLLGNKVRVLEIRSDFDGAVLVATAGLALYLAVRPGQARAVRVISTAVVLLSATMVFQLGSRSGILALGAVSIILAVSRIHLLRRLGWRRGAALAVALVSLAVVLVPHTYLFTRITADPRLSYAGAGTINARQLAWRLVIEDTARSSTRLAFGSGFGRDFLDQSGARFALEGPANSGVRAPHNFVLNTFGRLGTTGVVLLCWVGMALARAGLRVGRAARPPDHDLFLSFAVLLLVALGTASMVGVILESPFGAVPFWWAAGHLLAAAAGDQEPAAAESS